MPTVAEMIMLVEAMVVEAWRPRTEAVTTFLLEVEAATLSRMRVATMGGDDAQDMVWSGAEVLMWSGRRMR